MTWNYCFFPLCTLFFGGMGLESKLVLTSCRGIIYLHHVVLQEESVFCSLLAIQSFICTWTNSWYLFCPVFFVLLVNPRSGDWLFPVGSHTPLTSLLSLYRVCTCLNLGRLWWQKYSRLTGLAFISHSTGGGECKVKMPRDLGLGRSHFLVYRHPPISLCPHMMEGRGVLRGYPNVQFCWNSFLSLLNSFSYFIKYMLTFVSFLFWFLFHVIDSLIFPYTSNTLSWFLNCVVNFKIRTQWSGAWRDGSAIKRTCCSCRKPGFSSQHPCGSS